MKPVAYDVTIHLQIGVRPWKTVFSIFRRTVGNMYVFMWLVFLLRALNHSGCSYYYSILSGGSLEVIRMKLNCVLIIDNNYVLGSPTPGVERISLWNGESIL